MVKPLSLKYFCCKIIKSFTKFLNLIDKGLIMYDIRIGSYKTGKDVGKAHDHGSGFRILEKNLTKLYSTCETVE